MTMACRHSGRVAAIALLCFGRLAWGGDWDFEPRLELSETYRSNVNLAPDDLKEHDWLTQINPGFALEYTGVRGTIDLDYTLNGIISKEDSSRDDIYNEARLNSNLQLVENRFFVDLYGRYGQETVNPAGRVALDNTYDTDNRTDVGVWQVQPYWVQPLGRFALSTAYYSYSEVRYSNTDEDPIDAGFTNVEDSHTNSFQWILNGLTQSRFGWNTLLCIQQDRFRQRPGIRISEGAVAADRTGHRQDHADRYRGEGK